MTANGRGALVTGRTRGTSFGIAAELATHGEEVAFRAAGETDRVMLSVEEERASRQLTDGALAMFNVSNPLARLLPLPGNILTSGAGAVGPCRFSGQPRASPN